MINKTKQKNLVRIAWLMLLLARHDLGQRKRENNPFKGGLPDWAAATSQAREAGVAAVLAVCL